VKQINLALLSYSQDYDERLPGVNFTPGGGVYYYHFHAVIPYCKNVQLWKCPSKVGASFPSDGAQIHGFTTSSTISYDYNANLSWGGLALVESPSDVFTYWDANCGWCTSWANPPLYDMFRAGGNYYSSESPTHNGGQNYGFLDGHAKWLSLESVPYTDVRWSVH
jgi:prepilin-type processing-associated H-X9-DG protein